ncbi:helix-turn-helix domain-containing protein [Streptomyces bobili]|uniref:winged helix-turn-helix transcriptional regulator n=1 Tax=Streptomyces bobili TaxID=67280 RepID=UPI00342F6399
MTLGKDYTAQDCSIARALEIVGERWSLLIIRDALYGVRRYNDFLVHLGIPRASLAARLHALTVAGVLEKRRYQQSPPRDEYVVTDRGLALWPTLRTLSVWGRDHVQGNNTRTFRHADCGSELGPYGECPGCRTTVAPGQVEMVPGPDLNPHPSDPVSQALLRPKRLLEPLVIGNG